VVMSIAGSDSGGGAGIQADLRVFSRLGTFGTTVITTVTAQNLAGVSDVAAVPIETIAAQLQAVTSGFPVVAAKTGMLWSTPIVELVARARRESKVPFWVVDPVMVATSGARLLNEDAITAYRDVLLPVASLVTPNLDEAAVLLGVERIERAEMDDVARELTRRLGCAVLLKGGHLEGDPTDVLCAEGSVTRWHRPRLEHVNTHGTGCMLSAAVTAFVARGTPVLDACAQALEFVAAALGRPLEIAPGVRLAGIESAPACGLESRAAGVTPD